MAWKYKVYALEDGNGNELPPVAVTIPEKSHALAKRAAAQQVGGYWTEYTEVIREGEVAESEVAANEA